MPTYLPTIGLEIHFHLKTTSKMFCSCPNVDLAPPNTNICPVCTAQPGTLPVANRRAVEQVLLVGLALGCRLEPVFSFERKNYFYPDLPKGYQITSANQPPARDGYLVIGEKKIHINHIHLEEDTGSLKHNADNTATLVDYNRAGTPLVELVTEPDMTNGWEAKTFCQELQLVLRTLGVSDADLEKGQMRCEVNISLRPEGQTELGTKVEIKNIGSFRAVERAIDYEIARQTKILESGAAVSQETRGWDDSSQATVSQRVKEVAHDYRYFPEPDLPPVHVDQALVDELTRQLPELPRAKRERFASEYGLSAEDARLLTSDGALADFTERVMSELAEWLRSSSDGSDADDTSREKLARLAGGWLTSELFKLMNESHTPAGELRITPENFAEFLTMVARRQLNSTAAQTVLRTMFATGRDPSDIVETEQLTQVSDADTLRTVAVQVIAACPEQVATYRAGKTTVIQFLIGQVMKETRGTANPEVVHSLLVELLAGEAPDAV